jgi:U3 small nucleolar RNA-associated protein 14
LRKGQVGDEDSNSLKIDENDSDSSTGSDSGDYVNVLDVFDGRADSIIEEALPANHAHPNSQGIGSNTNTDAEEGKDTEVEEVEDAPGEEEPDGMLSADEDVNPSALEGLEKLVSSLETSRKRKGDTDVTNNSLQRKRRFMEERTAVGIEGEFTAVASGMSSLAMSDTILNVSRPTTAVGRFACTTGFSFSRRTLH